MSKGGRRNRENKPILLASQRTKSHPPHPCALVTQLPISHPLHTVGSLLVVIKSNLSLRPSLVPEKNCQGTLDCKVSLKQATYSNYSQSLKLAPLPSPLLLTDNSELRVTHPLLELPLGCLEKQALTASPLNFERPPSREFAQISRAERLKFTQKSAHETPFTGPTSQNAILETNLQISNWICQKVAAEIVKTSQFCCRHKVQKATLPTPVLWSHSCQSATHCTLWVHSNWRSKAIYHSGLA